MSYIYTNEDERLRLLHSILNPKFSSNGNLITPIMKTPKGKATIQLYPSTNENLSFVELLNVAGEPCLTTGSSCDQLFTLITNGALHVDLFDINPLTIDFYHLKKQAILHLPQTMCWGFLMCHRQNNYFLDKIMFQKIKPHLPAFEQEFWQTVVDSPNKMNLFRSDRQTFSPPNYLFNRENFKRLRANLKLSHTNFYQLPLSQLSYIPHEYKVVLLSNIIDWYPSAEQFFGDVERYLPFTSPDSVVQIGYFWNEFSESVQGIKMQKHYGEALVPIQTSKFSTKHYATFLDNAEYIRLCKLHSDYPYASDSITTATANPNTQNSTSQSQDPSQLNDADENTDES